MVVRQQDDGDEHSERIIWQSCRLLVVENLWLDRPDAARHHFTESVGSKATQDAEEIALKSSPAGTGTLHVSQRRPLVLFDALLQL
jgi:hypothetical protein